MLFHFSAFIQDANNKLKCLHSPFQTSALFALLIIVAYSLPCPIMFSLIRARVWLFSLCFYVSLLLSIYLSIYISISICISISIYLYIYISIYIHTHTHTHTYIYIHMCVCVYIYRDIYIYKYIKHLSCIM